MKSIILFCLFAVAIAAPSAPSFLKNLGHKRSKHIERGGSRYDFEQSSGRRFDSFSQPRDEDDSAPQDGTSFVIYVRPDGYISIVTYVTEQENQEEKQDEEEEEEPPGSAALTASLLG